MSKDPHPAIAVNMGSNVSAFFEDIAGFYYVGVVCYPFFK